MPNENEPEIGFSIGHSTDLIARTGCTVILFERATPTVVDVRGGAPGTRETDLLAPGRWVRRADALLFTGGSAFGLAAADGVMRYLQERGRGVQTSAGAVPIVPAAVIFDLANGAAVAPAAESGYEACNAATTLQEVQRGQVGAGAGATTGKLLGTPRRGGFGIGTVGWSGGSVSAVVVVNASGSIFNVATGLPIAGHASDIRNRLLSNRATLGDREATTLVSVLIDAPVDESTLVRSAVAAHDGMARAIRPCHTLVDGDVVFASGLRQGSLSIPDVINITVAVELAVELAIVDAVTA